MEKIITLIMAAVMGCTGFCGSYQEPQLADNVMRVTIVNETEDAVLGFGMDYVIDNQYTGGIGGMVADGTMNKGEELDLDIVLDKYDLEEKESFDFAMLLKVFSEDSTMTYVDSYAQWDAELKGEYEFVVSGSKTEGYDVAVRDEDFDCTIAPAAKLDENVMRVTFVNETEDAVSGFGIEYTIDGVKAGGIGGQVCDGPMYKGEEFDLDLMLDKFDLESKESFVFGMGVKIYLEDGTTAYVPYYAKWNAEAQGEYEFVVSGSKAEGYELTVNDADFDCTIRHAVG